MKIKKQFCFFLIVLLLCGCSQQLQSQTEQLQSQTEQAQSQTQQLQSQTQQAQDQAQQAQFLTSLVQAKNTEDKTTAVEATTDEKIEPVTANIVMVGDVLLHTRVSDSGRAPDGTYHYEQLFSHVESVISEADLAIVNQEVILGGTKLGLSGYPEFNGAFEVGDALAESGFDVVLHATNHALDKGKTGILNCISFWKDKHPEISVIGIYDSKKAQNEIYVKNVNGIDIAILNYTYGTNGIALPSDMPYCVNLLKEDRVRRDIKQAKKEADFVIVCPHWGTEYNHGISGEQEKWTKVFAEEGADLVIGTHPHVIEPVRWVNRPDGEKMLVYYSIGNFVNATSGEGVGTTDRMLGAIAKITIEKDEDGVKIESYSAEPVVSHIVSGYGNLTTYPLNEYSEELAEKNEIKKQDSTFSLKQLQEIWNSVMVSK